MELDDTEKAIIEAYRNKKNDWDKFKRDQLIDSESDKLLYYEDYKNYLATSNHHADGSGVLGMFGISSKKMSLEEYIEWRQDVY